MPQSATVVLQSHRQPLPHPWLKVTLGSVRRWAEVQGFEYRFVDDALFDELTPEERKHCNAQPVVGSDLARLRLCQRVLAEGAQRVVWCDADTLVLDPGQPLVLASPSAFGRELWLQEVPGSQKLKLYKKIHNAFMQFSAGNAVLDFYAFAAARLIGSHNHADGAPMVAQLAGPKFLTHLHNVVQFDVVEEAQVVSPVLATALLDGASDAPVLARYVQSWKQPPAALNLCASEIVRGNLSDDQMTALVQLLLESGVKAFFPGK